MYHVCAAARKRGIFHIQAETQSLCAIVFKASIQGQWQGLTAGNAGRLTVGRQRGMAGRQIMRRAISTRHRPHDWAPC